MTLREMQSIYFTSVGMNSTLLFGVPPSTTGAFDPKDATLLQEFGTWYACTLRQQYPQGSTGRCRLDMGDCRLRWEQGG